MIRVLILVALLFLAAAGFAWLAERPGELLLTWQGYEIRTSLMVAAIVIAVLIGAIAALGAIVRAIVSTPRSLGHFIGTRRWDRGYRALTRGMIAVGAGDARAAQRAAAESQSLLGSEPLVVLLAAQSAQIAGDGAAARTAFEMLSAAPDTRVLGLHGLFVEARRQGEHGAARHFAEEAMRIAPKIGWAGTALFDYQSRAGDWQGALATLAANQDARLIDKEKARRLRAVLDTARALDLEAGSPDEARALALEAHKFAPDLVPAATAAARLFARSGDIRRASRIIEATWKLAPHPELAEAYAAVRPGDSVRDRLKRVRRLADLRANHPEGAMAVARAALDAHDWPAARSALGGPMRANPSERVCMLMAEIEEGENGDQGRVRAWLTRALAAPRDPAWTADGEIFDRWAPVSPVSGRLDAIEWRVADGRATRRLVEIEADDAAPPVGPPPRQPSAEKPPPSSAASAGTGQTPALTQTTSAPSWQAAPPAAGTPTTTPPAPKTGLTPRPMARAPDDPGPLVPDPEEEPAEISGFRPGRNA